MTYQRHLITYQHLEREHLAGQAVNDNYFEDALMEAEERRQDHVRRTGTSVTGNIMDEATDCAMLMPPGPACWNLERRIHERTIVVASKIEIDEEGCHTSGSSIDEDSYSDD